MRVKVFYGGGELASNGKLVAGRRCYSNPRLFQPGETIKATNLTPASIFFAVPVESLTAVPAEAFAYAN